MPPSQLDDYVLTLRGLREKYADKLHIRIGLEAEYFPAYLGWLRKRWSGWTSNISSSAVTTTPPTNRTPEPAASAAAPPPPTAGGMPNRWWKRWKRGFTGIWPTPTSFLNRVTAFDADAEKACRDICAAAARPDIPLEDNMAGLTLQNRPDGSLGYTRDEFWRIAAEYPVKAIMGCDAHAPSELDVVPAIEEKKAFLHSLGIPVLDTLPGLE